MPTTTSDETIAAVADLVGDKWSMLVLRDVFRGVRRFDELCADLGMSRAVLTERLKRLVDAGVLTRVPYQERPVRYEYRLTPMGVELSPMLVALMRWGDRWLGDGATDSHARPRPVRHRAAPGVLVPDLQAHVRTRCHPLGLNSEAASSGSATEPARHPTPFAICSPRATSRTEARRADAVHLGVWASHCPWTTGRSTASAWTD